MQEDIKNYTLNELKEYFKKANFASFRARQVFGWLYAKRVEDFCLMTDIPKENRDLLKENFYFSKLKIIKQEVSCDKTQKFLLGLRDGASVESVFIPEASRSTLCVSSQVGCKYQCKFCLSGQSGFKRNLETSEIINQYLTIADLSSERITNIVFMGIGEPLDNFSNVIKAIKIFMEPAGLGFGKRRICVSTCGIAPAIENLAELKLGVKLSVSLHSADDKVRCEIMPVNRKYPLDELMKALKNFSRKEKYPVTFEYALLGNLNTSRLAAQKLIKLLKGINCKLNLIPYNASVAEFKQPSSLETEDFLKELERGGIFYTLRKSRGQDIHAACGQLRALWG